MGNHGAAAEEAVRGYGPEVFGFLLATLRNEQDATDVFSDFSVGLLSGLPKFDWRCSLRTWAYTIAHNASRRFRRDSALRDRRRAGSSALDEVVDIVRTQTMSFLKTETRSRLEKLRDALPPEDRELLVLRVDRDMAWNDLARALHEGEEPLSDAVLARESQRLRKRFQLIKDRLREAARREGLES
jgi:RNA polymerase sigma-70 factor (ECF subfamily)